ncbi:MAG: hypothetical protein LBS63_02435, partial [Prevotellaceae bacterium]|nr:hypothetical protein [Prevotellaceae bacterium]
MPQWSSESGTVDLRTTTPELLHGAEFTAQDDSLKYRYTHTYEGGCGMDTTMHVALWVHKVY